VKPFRDRFIGLPLQRSVFAGLCQAARAGGVEGAFPEGRLSVWFDAAGNLFVDPSHLHLLRVSLREALQNGALTRLDAAREEACAELAGATAGGSAIPPAGRAVERAVQVADAVSRVVPFALLAKVVPELLLGRLAEDGDEGTPPFPTPSPGRKLAVELAEVARFCRASGFDPERLARCWPAVPPAVSRSVEAFCRTHAGFGPVAWEAPGYETPAYAIAAMTAGAAGAAPLPLPAAPDGEPPPIKTSLAGWLLFLELEIWLVRRPFYLALAPLLRRAAGEMGVAPDLLLFADLDELREPSESLRAAEQRRATYLADQAYLRANGIEPGRLDAIMASP